MALRPVQRLVNKGDFERLLATRPVGRSAHFAVHHVAQAPLAASRPVIDTSGDKLSTGFNTESHRSVDDFPDAVWCGAMVPKRHARRAVTRSLLKRQIRSAFQRHAAALPRGLWLLRLRVGFPIAEYASAQSVPLARAARVELDRLLLQAGG